MTKTQKRCMQRLEVVARNDSITAQWPWPNPLRERHVNQHSIAPTQHDHKTGSSATPPQKKTPALRSVVAKPTDETIRLELDTRLKALETAVRRIQEAPEEQQEVEAQAKQELGRVARREKWPPRDNENVPTPSSTERKRL